MSDLYIDQSGIVVELVFSRSPCMNCIYYDGTKQRVEGRCMENKYAPIGNQCYIGMRWRKADASKED